MECIFCRIVGGELPSHKIWEDKNFFAFLDIHPINPGHMLLIPKKHVGDIFDLEEPLYSLIFKAAKKLSKPLRRAMRSKRVGIAIEGLAVPHIHLHLVPVNNENELDPHRAKVATQQELADAADKIKSLIYAQNA
jgi:histidine triad (HIT) family protein